MNVLTPLMDPFPKPDDMTTTPVLLNPGNVRSSTLSGISLHEAYYMQGEDEVLQLDRTINRADLYHREALIYI